MRRLLHAVLMLTVLVVAGPAAAGTLLAGHPVTAGLVAALTQGTGVTVETVVPASLPMGRQASFLTGRGEAAFAAAAARADAVVGLRSVWPADPLYPLARRVNVRVVEIDAARPLDGTVTGVTTRADAPFPWLGIANAGRMADIVAADLRRLYPAEDATIAANLARVKRSLLEVSAHAAQALVAAPDPSVAALSDRFSYLAADLGLEVRRVWALDDRDWTPTQLSELTAWLRREDIPVVLHHREPAAPIVEAVAAGGAKLVVLDTLEKGAPADLPAAFTAMVEAVVPALAR